MGNKQITVGPTAREHGMDDLHNRHKTGAAVYIYNKL